MQILKNAWQYEWAYAWQSAVNPLVNNDIWYYILLIAYATFHGISNFIGSREKYLFSPFFLFVSVFWNAKKRCYEFQFFKQCTTYVHRIISFFVFCILYSVESSLYELFCTDGGKESVRSDYVKLPNLTRCERDSLIASFTSQPAGEMSFISFFLVLFYFVL